jgi:hypothetical protein
VLADQQSYFVELTRAVKALVDAKKSPAEVKTAAAGIGAELRKNTRIARYVHENPTAHVQKVYLELGGQAFPK